MSEQRGLRNPDTHGTTSDGEPYCESCGVCDEGQRIMAFGIMLIVIGGIVALLAGCETAVEPESQQGTQGSVSTFWATTVDDRRIPCVSWQSGNHAGGLSCDWSLK